MSRDRPEKPRTDKNLVTSAKELLHPVCHAKFSSVVAQDHQLLSVVTKYLVIVVAQFHVAVGT